MVDKSLLIKALLEDDSKLFLISCPHRWGKSVNLNMVKTFLQIQTSGDQNLNVSITSSENYRLFVNGELSDTNKTKLTQPLLISKQKRIVDEYLGRWPVIYLNLAFDGRTCHTMKSDIVYAVQMAFDANVHALGPFFEAVHDNTTDPEIRAEAQRYIDKHRQISFFDSNYTDADMKMSLHFLSEILYMYYQKKVFILIDDYLSPWEAVFAASKMGFRNKANFLDFYADFFLNTFKENAYLAKGIITGEAPLVEELRKYAFDQIIECNMMTGKLMQYYGFNHKEVKQLSTFLNLPSTKQTAIWYWYAGHKANYQNFQIYVPWSIMNYLNKRKFGYYWVDGDAIQGYIMNFFKIYNFRKKFGLLVNGSEIIIAPQMKCFTWNDYEFLTDAMFSKIKMDHSMGDVGFMFLHALGFLTLREDVNVTMKTQFRTKFANSEVQNQMQKLLYLYYKNPRLYQDVMLYN